MYICIFKVQKKNWKVISFLDVWRGRGERGIEGTMEREGREEGGGRGKGRRRRMERWGGEVKGSGRWGKT